MFQIQLDTFVGVERILLVRFAVMAAHPAMFIKAPNIPLLRIFSRLLLFTIFTSICSQYSPIYHISTNNIHPFIIIFTHLLAIFTEVVMSCVA